MLRLVVLALLFGICTGAGGEKKQKAESLSRGWGNGISWAPSYDQALTLMVKSHKPLMVIMHLESCPYSQALKKAFVADKAIQKMAKEDFIMVNLVSETTDKNLSPDGYYVPRIMFVDPSLTVRADIYGKYDSHHYTYEPEDLALLAQNMKRAKVQLRTEL